jgi:mannose-1-phosphate guanylyltransferase/phosphomannomutase
MKAMVLAAGFGTRLGDLTRDLPKPMLPIAGHPLLAYLLGHLRSQGFNEVAINLHFHPEAIRDHFGDGSRWGMRLTYSLEETLLGTAGGVRNIAAYFRSESEFLVQYGDVITDQDFAPLLKLHRERNALATLLVHERARSNSMVEIAADGRITGFLERPTDAERERIRSSWVNSGVCLCSPEILDLIPDGRPSDFPRDVFRPLLTTGRLFAVPLSGYRCAIDSPERLASAREAIASGQCRIAPLHAPPPSQTPSRPT